MGRIIPYNYYGKNKHVWNHQPDHVFNYPAGEETRRADETLRPDPRVADGQADEAGQQDVDLILKPIGSMYAIYGNIYHEYTPNVSIYIYTMHGSYGLLDIPLIEHHLIQ